MTEDPGRRLPFVEQPLPRGFERRVYAVDPGQARTVDGAEWRDAIVVVERGQLVVECAGGAREAFASGDVLYLGDLPVRRIRNPGREPAVLIAVLGPRRRGPVRHGGRRPSPR